MAEGPLAGFRVLDLTQAVSGPFCTMLLGDLGADVIKVEAPTGDTARLINRPGRNRVGAYFLMFNRNKRGVVIDVRTEHGRDLIRRLAAKSDVMIENNRPGVADRLGIGYADIRRVNPKIVYCAIHGFAPDGPMADAPAYDPVIQGFTGIATIQGGPGGKPTAVKTVLADKISGFTAAIGIAAALHAARARGVGQYLRIPMVEAMMNFVANDTMVGYAFVPPDEYKHQTPKNGSLDPFRTKDGYVTIAPYSDDQWQRLLSAIGHPEWWEVPDRRERLRTCLRGIAKLFPERESTYWLQKIEEADCPGGPVHTYDTLFSDPEIAANESFATWEHPQAGTVRSVNPGMRFSETPAKFWRCPPALGEHTEEVLREAEVSSEEIAHLRSAKVIN
jgi:formyl-CoA transferase